MRMLAAELLKLRRRWATYIVLVLLIVLMGLIFFLVGLGGRTSGASQVIRFPQAFGLINQFVFGLGSLLAVAYAAAIGGADWNWGVFRVVIARGESRGRYILVKYIGLAIVILIGCVIAFAAGILLTYFAGTIAGASVGDPFTGSGPGDIATSLALGFPVIAERAAIGFAVAVLLRSQLAGVVVGIILYIGESILAAVLIATNLSGAFSGGGGFPRLGQQWYQFLPFSIGDSVLSHGPSVTGQDLEGLILTPVPLDAALAATLIYLAAALALVVVSVERSEITA
ncbi:MAG: ABC transporter permease subunit [Chloroflexi bacterium]|nr:ABC transporter permease subunit [Chloroflexota bacterium]